LPARPAAQGCHIIVLVEQSADFGCSATAGRVVDIAAASPHVDAKAAAHDPVFAAQE